MQRAEHLYDLTRQMHPRKLSLPNGAYITNAFDPVARLLSTALKNSGNTALDSYTYIYNTSGERPQVARADNSWGEDNSFVDYTYDAMGQLKSASGRQIFGVQRLHEQFGYDQPALFDPSAVRDWVHCS